MAETQTFGEVRLGRFQAPLKMMHANPFRRKVERVNARLRGRCAALCLMGIAY